MSETGETVFSAEAWAMAAGRVEFHVSGPWMERQCVVARIALDSCVCAESQLGSPLFPSPRRRRSNQEGAAVSNSDPLHSLSLQSMSRQSVRNSLVSIDCVSLVVPAGTRQAPALHRDRTTAPIGSLLRVRAPPRTRRNSLRTPAPARPDLTIQFAAPTNSTGVDGLLSTPP